MIHRNLRRAFDLIEAEPLPAHLVDLLDRLKRDRRETEARHDQD